MTNAQQPAPVPWTPYDAERERIEAQLLALPDDASDRSDNLLILLLAVNQSISSYRRALSDAAIAAKPRNEAIAALVDAAEAALDSHILAIAWFHEVAHIEWGLHALDCEVPFCVEQHQAFNAERKALEALRQHQGE